MIDINGTLYSENIIPFSPLDASAYYGLSVYETFFVKRSKVAFFDDHYSRLEKSCQYFQIPIPEKMEVKQRIQTLIQKENVELGRLRLIVSPGSYKEIVSPKTQNSFLNLERLNSTPKEIQLLLTNVRKPDPPLFPPFAKVSSNLLSLLSYREAILSGYQEGIMLTTNNHIAEGSYCNLFWSKGKELYTPSLECSILEGVTRSKILEVCESLDLTVHEGKYFPEELDSCDNLYISSSTRGLLYVSKYNDRLFSGDIFHKSLDIKNSYEVLQDESLEVW